MVGRQSASRAVFQVFNYAVLTFLGLCTLFPFLYIFIVSLGDPAQYAATGIIFPPQRLTLSNYAILMGPGSRVLAAYGATMFITFIGTAISMLLTSGIAYALSRKYLPMRNFFTMMIFFTMIFSGGLIPTYMVVMRTGLMGTLWSVMIPNAISAWYMFIMRNYYMSIPPSMEESAKIDGANDLLIMFRIMWPISLPVMACVGLFYATDRWNEWFFALLYINDPSRFPVSLVLRDIITMNASAIDPNAMDLSRVPPSDIVRMTAICISVLPILVVYPLIQRYFASGIMIGAIKG